MKIFMDTSSLFKKYHVEHGSEKLFEIFEKTTEVIVSPITYVEVNNTIKRYYSEKKITKEEFNLLSNQINKDFQYFQKIRWDDLLENICISLINKYQLKSLDVIQLASAKYSNCQQFITSDKKQYHIAQKELKKAILV